MTATVEIPDLEGVIAGSRADLSLDLGTRRDVSELILQKWEEQPDGRAEVSTSSSDVEGVKLLPESQEPEAA